ncbi:MAG: ice-binding family protein [Candidatus Didemnitutus sp.]|nr:ice-binding family protein [Candidatus Didemnitutus sp.]
MSIQLISSRLLKRHILPLGVLLGFASAFIPVAHAQTILGSMDSYGLMAGGTVTINGLSTTINGDLGKIGAIAGAGSNYTITNGAEVTTSATPNQADFTRAFTGLAGMTPTADLTGKILGTTAGATVLTPGIYKFDATAQLTGVLTLDAQNQSNAVWVFQIGSTFDTAAGSSVVFTNLAANSVVNDGIFWRVGTTTFLGANSVLVGNILGGTTINFGAGAAINYGRALTGSNTMTLDSNTIDFVGSNSGYSGGLGFVDSGTTIAPIPEPSTYALLAGCMTLAFVVIRRRRMPR